MTIRTTITASVVTWLTVLSLTASALADTKLVNASTLADLQIPIVFSAPAETVSLQRTRISAEITGRIIDMPAQTGDEISAGGTLVTLDCRDYQFDLKRAQADHKAAEAQLQLANQRLQRTLPLIDRKHVSQDIVDQRRSELDAAIATAESRQVQVDQAKTNVSRCVIKSPFRAAVMDRHAGVGELARAGTYLLDIQDLDRVEVSAQIVPNETSSLQHAPDVFLEFLGRRFALRVNRISPVIDSSTRTQEIRLSFLSDTAPVGASGRLSWTEPAPGLPAHLLVQRDGQLGVFTIEQETANFIPLINAVEGRPARLDAPGSTLIVTNGRHNLESGDRVRLEN